MQLCKQTENKRKFCSIRGGRGIIALSVSPKVTNRAPGLYTPDSNIWHINRELALLATGPRALLLEIAHPLVAAGVAQHSNFERNPLGRLFRTVQTMQRLSFGNGKAVLAGTRHVATCHVLVTGTLPATEGPYPAGTPYSANDPDLKLWVYATLIDSILLGYEQFVRPLTIEEKSAYYLDSLPMAHHFGIPRSVLPPDYTAFEQYMRTILTGDILHVGPTALRIKDALFQHPTIGWLVRLGGQIGVGMLPRDLRAAFGFEWTAAQQRRLNWFSGFSRAVYPYIPLPLRTHPQAWMPDVSRQKR